MPKSRIWRASMAILSIRAAGGSDLTSRGSSFDLPAVKRELIRQLLYFAPHVGQHFFGSDVTQHAGDQGRGLAHLRLAKTARGHGRASEANAAGIERRIHIKRNGVLVDGDARPVERRLGFFTAHAL